MSGDLIRVCLLGPTKLGAAWLKAGAEPEVTAEEKAALIAAGVVAPDETDPADADAHGEVLVYTEAQFHAKLKEILAESDERINASIGNEISRLKAERDAAIADVDGQRELVSTLEAQVADLQRELLLARAHTEPSPDGQAGEAPAGVDTAEPQSGAAPADQNTSPTEKAAKTAPKKGAAATKA